MSAAPPGVTPDKKAAPPDRLIPLGAIATVVGIALCLLVDPILGGLAVIGGVLSQAWGLHLLGRGRG
jgi:tetrahydromethanopterin S-methyltransferase subunit C